MKIASRWIKYNPNPMDNRAGDCTVRAISKAMSQDWDTSFIWLCIYGFMMCNMPSANCVWGKYLSKNGFKCTMIWEPGKRYTVDDFCRDNPKGTFILAIDGHVVCVVDGFYYDTWDSGGEIPIYCWAK